MGVLTMLFGRIWIQTNEENMVGMVYQQCHMDGRHSEAAYERRMTGVGPYFWVRQWERVRCLECAAYLAVGLLVTHPQDKNRMGLGAPVVGNPTTTVPQDIQGLLTHSVWVYRGPS